MIFQHKRKNKYAIQQYWEHLQTHPVVFFVVTTLLWSMMWGIPFGSIMFIIMRLTKPETMSRVSLLSLLSTSCLFGVIGGFALSLYLWIRLKSEQRTVSQETIQHFATQLQDQDKAVRRTATFELARLFDTRAVPPLLHALQDEEAEVRETAAWGLGNIRAPQAFEPLLQTLHDPNMYVRGAAIEALGYVGDTRAVPLLIQILQNREAENRGSAIQALGCLRDTRAVAPLIQTLQDKDALMRWMVMLALEEIGDPQAIEPLTKALQDSNASVRETAATALKTIQESPRTYSKAAKITCRTFAYDDDAHPRIEEPLHKNTTHESTITE